MYLKYCLPALHRLTLSLCLWGSAQLDVDCRRSTRPLRQYILLYAHYITSHTHTHMSPHRFGEIIIFCAHFYVTLCFCIKLSRLPQKVAVSLVSLHSSCSAKRTCGKYSFSKIASYSHTVVFIVVVVFTILLLSSSSPQYTNASYQSTEPHIVNEKFYSVSRSSKINLIK